MTSLLSLCVPIVLAAVVVFVASSIVHMALSWWHSTDFKKVPAEDQVMDALRPFAIPPGDYMLPLCSNMEEMKTAEFKAKMKLGPVVMMTVMPNEPFGIGKSLLLWFIYLLVVSFFAGHVAGLALAPGASFHRVFRLAAIPAFLGYAGALWQASIWYRRSWTTTIKSTLDSLVYAVLTGFTFAWLWPR